MNKNKRRCFGRNLDFRLLKEVNLINFEIRFMYVGGKNIKGLDM